MQGVNTIAALAAAVSRKHSVAHLGRARLGRKAGLMLAAVAAGLALSLPAADVGLVPFFMRGTDGKMDGFSNDLTQEVAQRMGYDGAEVIDTPFSAIFAGLFSSRYDMVAAPTNTTQERAQQMLFAEPYMASAGVFVAI
jgi:polar amino acid transport system substrate-binding protein